MVRALNVFCCFIVALQILVGVPLLVCVGFFAVQGGVGPIAIEIHAMPAHTPHMLVHGPTIPAPAIHLPQPPSAPSPMPLAISPPPNVIPPVPPVAPSPPAAPDNPILQTRAEQGSPLDGTILTNSPPNVERDLFVAALEKVAAEAADEALAPSAKAATACPAAIDSPCCPAASETAGQRTQARAEADDIVLQRLYEIADIDERAGNYERADQLRALARDVRRGQTSSQPLASELEDTDAAGPALVSP